MGVSHVALTILCAFSFISTGISQMTPSARTCTSQGFFDIVEDATCQSYYLCIFDGTSFKSYDNKCATGMVFYPAIGTCTLSTMYTCTHTTPTTIATTPTTNATTPTTNATTPTTPTTNATTPTTPTTNATTPTTPTTSATTPTTPTTTIAPCTASGRFRIPDPNCKLYYFCYVDGATIVQYYNLTCPNSLQFNPQKQKCVLPNTFNCTAAGG